MRGKALAAILAVAVLAPTAPAAARHWRGHSFGYHSFPRFSWSVGVGLGWGYWGPGWGWWGPPVMYQPVPVTAARTNLTVVDTDIEPEHARVYLNGELIGVADDFDGYPDYLYLEPGHYTLEVRLQGYKTEKIEIDASAGRYVPIKMKLERIPGEKAAPWYDRPEGLPVGRVFGPKQAQQGSASKPGPDTSLRPELRGPAAAGAAAHAAQWGALDLRVSPANAAVYLDGTMMGTAQELGRLERGLAVTPGRHTVQVLAPGYASRTVEIDVKEDQRQQVVVDLEQGTGQSE